MAWSASFLTWMDQPVRDAVLLWKLTALNGGSPVTLYVATEARRTPSTDTPANTNIPGIVLSDLSSARGMPHPWSTTVGTGGAGGVSIELANPDGAYDAWEDYDWRDQVQEAYLGDRSWPISSFERIYKGWADYVTSDEDRLTIVLGDPMARFDRPLQPARFSDDEVNPAVHGQAKPKVLGRAHFIEPALIDHVDLRYQFGSDTTDALDKVFANGFELDPIAGLVSAWDSAATTSDVTLSNGDQTVDFLHLDANWDEAKGEDGIDLDTATAPVYFEIVLDAHVAEFQFGIGDSEVDDDSGLAFGEFYGVYYTTGRLWLVHGTGGFPTVVDVKSDLFQPPVVGEVFGFLVDPVSRLLTVYRNGRFLGDVLVEPSTASGDDVWYPNARAVNEATATLRTGWAEFDFLPPGLLTDEVFGQTGEYINSPGNVANLARNPTRAKISAHAASVTPARWEDWSTPSAWVGSNGDLTVQCSTGNRSGYVPAPRATDRFVVEIECDTKASTPAVQLAALPWDPDTFTFGAGREGDGGISWYSNGNVYAGEAPGSVVASAGTWTSGDILGLVLDKAQDRVELYKNGTLKATVEGYKIAGDWSQARGPFSGSNYFTVNPAADSYVAGKTACGCFRIMVFGTPSTEQRVVNWAGTNGVRIGFTAERKLIFEAFDSGGTRRGAIETSALATGRTYAILWSIDTDEEQFNVWVDDADDTTVVEAVTASFSIDWATTLRSIGAGGSGGAPLEDAALGFIGYAPNQWLDFSDKAVRRTLFDANHQPTANVYSDAFSSQPAIWCTDGDASSNSGNSGNFTEAGTVPEADPSTFRTVVLAPAVYSSSSSSDLFTVGLTDHVYAYDGAVPWGEAAGAAELIHAVAGGDDDFETNHAAAVASGSLLGVFDRGELTVQALLERVAQSVGGGLSFTRDGELRLVVLTPPENATADFTIVASRQVPEGQVISRVRDRGERLSTQIAAWRVWSPHRAGEVAGAVDLDLADLIQREHGIIVEAGSTMPDEYSSAAEAEPVDTLISDGNPLDRSGPRSAVWLSQRIAQLYPSGTRRHFYTVPFEGVVLPEVGDIVSLQIDRWGMSSGKKLIVLNVEEVDIDSAGTLVCWG